MLAIERTRKDADAAAKANADAIAARLESIEQTLSAQQNHEVTLLQDSNRVTLIAAGVFGGLGLLAMMFTAWFLVRAMNRLAAVAGSFPSPQAIGPAQAASFVSTDIPPINLGPVEPGNTRLLGVIDKLEKRVNELEHTSQLPLKGEESLPHHVPGNGAKDTRKPSVPVISRTTVPVDVTPSADNVSDRISVILGKGQALLSIDKADEAAACFDEALALDPNHAEALVKKGTALERLKRLEEAIAHYDRAIAANRAMTLAYLYKGGVCNQLERFSEALECYEMALRSQQKSGIKA